MISQSPTDVQFPLLTIAMPVFNGGTQLRLALLSIIHQSFSNWELILIDDGSTDKSVDELKDITDTRIRFFCDGHNKGLAARLNEAIDLARGEFFARMDHDDISHPDRFSRQLEILQGNLAVDLLGTRCITISECNQIVGVLPGEEKHEDICQKPWLGFHMPHPTWMGRTAWFRKHLYATPGPYCCEDQELLLRTHEVSRFHVLPEYLLAYRLRDRFSFAKAWRTRRTFYRIQQVYFTNKGDNGSVLLAQVCFFLRATKDVWTIISQNVFFKGGKASQSPEVSEVNVEMWHRIIGNLNGVHLEKGRDAT